jgi:hypothetical protein
MRKRRRFGVGSSGCSYGDPKRGRSGSARLSLYNRFWLFAGQEPTGRLSNGAGMRDEPMFEALSRSAKRCDRVLSGARRWTTSLQPSVSDAQVIAARALSCA